MITTFEHLSVELYYEIFAYFHLHERLAAFSNLNSRLTTIVTQMPLLSVYLGLDGMDMALTQFYYEHTTQSNICCRLITLCVSDTLAIGNCRWLASYLYLFVSLRHLALIDMQRVDLESILKILSFPCHLVIFLVKFTRKSRAVSTYRGVGEGTYHERIFRSLPHLRVCQLSFHRRMYITHEQIQPDVVTPFDSAFIPIVTTLSRLKTLSLGACSLVFLSHLVKYVPQLEALRFSLCTPWLPKDHPLMNSNSTLSGPIDRSLVPNLRRLKISWNNLCNSLQFNGHVQQPTDLFSRDVFFHLTHFSLAAEYPDFQVVQGLLSMLSRQCSYSLDICKNRATVPIVLGQPMTSMLVLNTLRQLKSRKSVELELEPYFDSYNIRAYTLPRKCRQLDITKYLSSRTVLTCDRWPGVKFRTTRCFPNVNKLILNARFYSELVDHWISHMPAIVPWNQIIHLTVNDRLELAQLRSILYHTSRLHTLELKGSFNCIDELLEDTSTCNTLMSNGLRKLIFSLSWDMFNIMQIAQMIVERLPQLQFTRLYCTKDEMPTFLYTLINGLPHLTYLVADCGGLNGAATERKLRALQTPDTRPFRTEIHDSLDNSSVYVWL